jgi:hypothetical protein
MVTEVYAGDRFPGVAEYTTQYIKTHKTSNDKATVRWLAASTGKWLQTITKHYGSFMQIADSCESPSTPTLARATSATESLYDARLDRVGDRVGLLETTLGSLQLNTK